MELCWLELLKALLGDKIFSVIQAMVTFRHIAFPGLLVSEILSKVKKPLYVFNSEDS